MSDSILVCVSAAQVSAAVWRGGRFTTCTVFENDDNGVIAFREFLQTAKRHPVKIIVDAVEEDYRFESLPHSFGSDRAEMLNRKLKQHYRNTPYFSARLQGRDAGKRRDDRYLFCALTNPELVSNWLKPVQELGFPVVGIFLLPTVSAAMPEKLGIKQSNLLLVSLHTAGMRLTYFRDQKLRISRLARAEAKGPNAIKGYAPTSTAAASGARRFLPVSASPYRRSTHRTTRSTCTCWDCARRKTIWRRQPSPPASVSTR